MAKAFGYTLGVEDLHRREIAVQHGRVPAPAKAGRPDSYGHGRERGMKISLPGTRRAEHHAAALSALVEETGRQTGRAHRFVFNAAFAEAGALRGGPARSLCAGIRRVRAFHFADSALSGSDRASHAEVGAGASAAERSGSIRIRRAHAEAVVYSHKQLEELATETSDAERRAASAERELRDWKTAQFMEAASRRRIRRADHFGAEIRLLRGTVRSISWKGCCRSTRSKMRRARVACTANTITRLWRWRAGTFAQRTRRGESQTAPLGTGRPRESPRRAHRSHAPSRGVCAA